LLNDFWNDPEALANLEDILDVAGADLINLGARLRAEGLSDEELQAVRELGDALRAGLRGNPELIEAEYQALINQTEQLELSLQAGNDRAETTVRTEAPTQAVPGTEDAVAEYYRRLGRSQD